MFRCKSQSVCLTQLQSGCRSSLPGCRTNRFKKSFVTAAIGVLNEWAVMIWQYVMVCCILVSLFCILYVLFLDGCACWWLYNKLPLGDDKDNLDLDMWSVIFKSYFTHCFVLDEHDAFLGFEAQWLKTFQTHQTSTSRPFNSSWVASSSVEVFITGNDVFLCHL